MLVLIFIVYRYDDLGRNKSSSGSAGGGGGSSSAWGSWGETFSDSKSGGGSSSWDTPASGGNSAGDGFFDEQLITSKPKDNNRYVDLHVNG